MPCEGKASRRSGVLKMPGVIEEDEEFSDCVDRPSGPVDYSDESQRLVDAVEKEGGNRRVSVMEDNREFNFELFNNEFIKNSKALYEDVAILIAEKNDAVEEVYELR